MVKLWLPSPEANICQWAQNYNYIEKSTSGILLHKMTNSNNSNKLFQNNKKYF